MLKNRFTKLVAILSAAAFLVGCAATSGANARVGAVSGAVGAGVDGERNQRTIINRCLGGRGYKVLQ